MADENKTPQELELEKQINELAQQKQDLSQQEALAIEERIALRQKELKLLQDARASLQQQSEELEAQAELLQEKLDATDDEAEKEKLQAQLAEVKKEKIKKEIEMMRQKGELTKDAYKEKLKEIEGQDKLAKSEKQQVETATQKKSILESITGEIGKAVTVAGQLTGGFTNQITSVMTLSGFLSKIGDMVKEVADAQSDLVASTGQVGLAAGGASMAFGLGYAKMTQSFGDLYNNMSSFSALNKETQRDLAFSAAKMQNLGVGASEYGKMLNQLTQASKMSAKESSAAIEGVAKAAMGMGMAPKAALQAYSSALPQLAANGSRMTEVFTTMLKQSKGLGLELNELLGIANKFDTFESAAQNAGQLNAVLGGDYLNSVDMLNASEEERIKMMREAFAASGKSFENMDRFEQKAIAASLGLKDVGEAQKLFGTMSAENEAAINSQAKSQKDLNAAQSAAAKMGDKLNQIMASFYPLVTPILDALNKFVNWFAGLSQWGQRLVILIPILAQWFIKLYLAKKQAAEGSQALGKTGGGAARSISAIGKAGAKAWPSILAIGGAMVLAGIGIAIAAYGLSKLVTAFKELNPDQLKAAIIAITVVMLGFIAMIGILGAVMVAGPGAAAIVAVLALGVAAILLAVALNLAVDPILAIIEALNKSKNILIAAVDIVKILADAVVKIARAIIDGFLVAIEILMPYIERMFNFALPLLIDAFKFLMPIIKEIIQIIIETLIPAVADLAKHIMDVLLKAFKFIIPPIERLITVIINQLAPIIKEIIVIIGDLAKMIVGGLLNAFANLLDKIVVLADMFSGRVLTAFKGFMVMIEKVADVVVGGFVKSLELVKDIIQFIAGLGVIDLAGIASDLYSVAKSLGSVFDLGGNKYLSPFLEGVKSLYDLLSKKIDNGLVSELNRLVAALMEMPQEINTKINTVRGVKDIIQSVALAGPLLDPAKQFVDAAKEFYDAQKESKDASDDSLVKALEAVFGSNNTSTTTASGDKSANSKRPVIIRLENGKDLFGHIMNYSAQDFTNSEE